MTDLQTQILASMPSGKMFTAREIAGMVGRPERAVINALCYLRGNGYVTDGRGAIAYENGIEVWRTPMEYDYHIEGGHIFWKKLPFRFAASPTDIQERYGMEAIQ